MAPTITTTTQRDAHRNGSAVSSRAFRDASPTSEHSTYSHTSSSYGSAPTINGKVHRTAPKSVVDFRTSQNTAPPSIYAEVEALRHQCKQLSEQLAREHEARVELERQVSKRDITLDVVRKALKRSAIQRERESYYDFGTASTTTNTNTTLSSASSSAACSPRCVSGGGSSRNGNGNGNGNCGYYPAMGASPSLTSTSTSTETTNSAHTPHTAATGSSHYAVAADDQQPLDAAALDLFVGQLDDVDPSLTGQQHESENFDESYFE
ncbi:hypothetical protein Pelo_5205 [Pelomyxa schiedti]|nr:hypothetical protein Pelo_5205 [Pelomyxa schiedti]